MYFHGPSLFILSVSYPIAEKRTTLPLVICSKGTFIKGILLDSRCLSHSNHFKSIASRLTQGTSVYPSWFPSNHWCMARRSPSSLCCTVQAQAEGMFIFPQGCLLSISGTVSCTLCQHQRCPPLL